MLVELADRVVEYSGHDWHAPMLDAFVALDQVPAAHGMATPAEHQLPAGHSAHSSALLSPGAFPTLPSLHGVGAELPSAHQLCTVHSVQFLAPSLSW
jgi:hypothetical protein